LHLPRIWATIVTQKYTCVRWGWYTCVRRRRGDASTKNTDRQGWALE
jgi:hypothetical protein